VFKNRDKTSRAGKYQNVIDDVSTRCVLGARKNIDDGMRPQVRRVFRKVTAALAPLRSF